MTEPEIDIRPAAAADIERLARWACAMAWETERKRLDLARVRAGVTAVLEQPARGRYLLACRGDTLLGTLMLTYEWSDWRCADWWWIQSVYVDPAHRRQGVYRALHAHVEQAAAAAGGVCGLRLYVEADNAGAQSTYHALDMVDAGYRMFEKPL